MNRVDPISPKVVLVGLVEPPIETTPLPPNPGALNVGWLRILKKSARNCAEIRSLNLIDLYAEKSNFFTGGVTVCPGREPKAAAPVAVMHPAGVPGLPTSQG